MSRKRVQHMLETCPTHTTNMSNTCPKHVRKSSGLLFNLIEIENQGRLTRRPARGVSCFGLSGRPSDLVTRWPGDWVSWWLGDSWSVSWLHAGTTLSRNLPRQGERCYSNSCHGSCRGPWNYSPTKTL